MTESSSSGSDSNPLFFDSSLTEGVSSDEYESDDLSRGENSNTSSLDSEMEDTTDSYEEDSSSTGGDPCLATGLYEQEGSRGCKQKMKRCQITPDYIEAFLKQDVALSGLSHIKALNSVGELLNKSGSKYPTKKRNEREDLGFAVIESYDEGDASDGAAIHSDFDEGLQEEKRGAESERDNSSRDLFAYMAKTDYTSTALPLSTVERLFQPRRVQTPKSEQEAKLTGKKLKPKRR